MEIRFEFQHDFLMVNDSLGFDIYAWRKWLEEVIEDVDTQIADITQRDDLFPIHFAVGFCNFPLPILYVFERDRDIIRSLYARLATKEEVISELQPPKKITAFQKFIMSIFVLIQTLLIESQKCI